MTFRIRSHAQSASAQYCVTAVIPVAVNRPAGSVCTETTENIRLREFHRKIPSYLQRGVRIVLRVIARATLQTGRCRRAPAAFVEKLKRTCTHTRPTVWRETLYFKKKIVFMRFFKSCCWTRSQTRITYPFDSVSRTPYYDVMPAIYCLIILDVDIYVPDCDWSAGERSYFDGIPAKRKMFNRRFWISFRIATEHKCPYTSSRTVGQRKRLRYRMAARRTCKMFVNLSQKKMIDRTSKRFRLSRFSDNPFVLLPGPFWLNVNRGQTPQTTNGPTIADVEHRIENHNNAFRLNLRPKLIITVYTDSTIIHSFRSVLIYIFLNTS